MKIIILPIGRIKTSAIGDIVSDYANRLKHYCSFDIRPCKDDREALSVVKAGDLFVQLDAEGAQQSSEDFAKFIADHQMRGTKRLLFFIGGPDGPGAEVRSRADAMLSLSRMTFPHEIAQAMLLEQLYRAFTILKGEPYHK
jgi:23S rRNA (pseudouridine1915-N3)-methyltransferase